MKSAALIQAARPKTLTASLVPCMVAGAYAMHELGFVPWGLLLSACASALMIQIGTNYFNDVYDFKKGADTAERMGPRRATLSKDLSPRQVFSLGVLAFGLALLFSIPLVIKAGIPILILGLVSLLAGYLYTAGPFPLAYVGLGEVFVILFFGWAAVGGLAYLFDLPLDGSVWILATQIGLLSAAMIAINNLRDARTDVFAGKKTLAVRLGIPASKVLIQLFLIAPYIMSLYYIGARQSYWAGLLPWVTLPLALRLCGNIRSAEPSPLYNEFLAQAAKIQLLFGLTLTVAWLL